MHEIRIPRDVPPQCALRITLQETCTRAAGMIAIGGAQTFTVPLYENSKPYRRPLWYQDSKDVPHEDLNGIGLRVPFWHDVVKFQLPTEIQISDHQAVSESQNFCSLPSLGDKVYIVGFPYGYSSAGMQQPTPIVLTRFIAAVGIAGSIQRILLESAGAPGMSGGPVFVESNNQLELLGLYTGMHYPDHIISKNEKFTALGTCCNMILCWASLPLVPYPQSGPSIVS